MTVPNKSMKIEAEKGLKWRKEFGRGGTRVGQIRARQIVAGENLSDTTIKRMYSYFARHEVDKKAEGFKVGEKGYPSNGRIAWALWGGDAGFTWSKNLVEKMDNERHIQNVVETEDSYIIEFGKAMPETAEEETEEIAEDIAIENAYDDEEDDEKRFAEAKQFSTRELNQELINEEKRTVRIALTSETPVMRSFGYEILSHDAEDIDMSFMASGRSPLLLDHDPEKQIGVIESYSLDRKSRRTLAQVRFGKSDLAKEVFNDVLDGIRQNVSVGYQVTKMRKDENEKNTYRVSFFPMEASIVSIPADQSAGVGVARSKLINPSNIQEVNKMEEKNITESKVEPTVDVQEVRTKAFAEAKSDYSKQVDEILELGARHNKSDLSRKAIRNGASLSDFRSELLNEIGSQPLDTKEIGLTEKEARSFSIMRAVRSMANPHDRKLRDEASFEFEASEEAKTKFGRSGEGLTLPVDVMGNWSARDINTGDDAGGVGQDFYPERFIDALRNASAVVRAGATVLDGLVGDVKIPKQTGVSTAGWISAEGGASAESEMSLGSITMSPKTASMYTEVTNMMMQQSSLDIERLIRNDLASGIANLIDTGALAGSGSSGQPTGIDNTSGVNTVDSTANNPTFAEIVAMESAILGDNSVLNNGSYVTTSAMAGAMKVKAKDSGSGLFVLENGQANGYPVIVSNAVTSGVIYLGNWTDLLIGMFGSLDILVDPYTNSANSVTRLRATQFIDVACRHGQSFCKAT